MKVRLGTRWSELARAQAKPVALFLRDQGHEVEWILVKTRGDQETRPIAELSGTAFFTHELEVALLEHGIDLAVHSLKDLPARATPGLSVAAIPIREVAADVLLLRSAQLLQEEGQLVQGARIGTSSARRIALLQQCYGVVEVRELRGNVPTRLARLRAGEYDGIVVARAGLLRLQADLSGLHALDLEPTEFVPAPGQGALALQVREDSPLGTVIASLDHAGTRQQVEAERWLLRQLEGGCSLPLGAVVQSDEGSAVLSWCWQRAAGFRRGQVRATSPMAAARKALRAMAPRILLTRPTPKDRDLQQRLLSSGCRVEQLAAIDREPLQVDAPTLPFLEGFEWMIFTSRHAVERFVELGHECRAALATLKIAVVGPASAEAVLAAGGRVAVQALPAQSARLAELLQIECQGRATRFLFPAAADPLPHLPEALRQAGHEVEHLPLYRTRSLPWAAGALLDVDAVVLCSPSAVQAFVASVSGTPPAIVAGGETTAEKVLACGFRVAEQAAVPSTEPLADAVLKLSRSWGFQPFEAGGA